MTGQQGRQVNSTSHDSTGRPGVFRRPETASRIGAQRATPSLILGYLAGGAAAGAGSAAVTGRAWLIPLCVAAAAAVAAVRSHAAALRHAMRQAARRLIHTIGTSATRVLYRIDVHGLENIPSNSGALLVCNHVSYMDACLVETASGRLMRFLMHRTFYCRPLLGALARTMGAIPVASEDATRDLMRSLHDASRRVAAGDTVCIFAEGAISRTGSLLPFTRGLEVIMRGSTAPIVPVHIDVEPGSFTSFRRGRLVRTFNPFRRIRGTVSFGRPLAPESSAASVRQAVAELGAETACGQAAGEGLGDRFLKNARRHPFRPCMADETGAQLSYAQTAVRAFALADALGRELPGATPIGILLPTGIPAALVNLAAAFLGRPAVNLNYTAGAATVASAVHKCGTTRVVTSRQFLDHLGWATDGLDLCFLEDLKPAVAKADAVRAALRFIMGARPARRTTADTNGRSALPRDLATILFSSGSTGNPKGVMLSHGNLNANITAMMQMYGLSPKDRLLGSLPFFHCFGLTATLWLPLTSGLSVVFQRNPLDFKISGRLIRKHRATVLLSTPTFLTGYLRRCTPRQLASLRHVAVGAEKLSDKLRDAFERRFGITPREGYGATELSPFATANIPDAYAGKHVQTGTRPGTVGRPLPGTAARIVDPDTGEQRLPGERGLLLIRGPGVMLGYLGDPGRTAEVIENGWYRTGDIASIDEDGFVTLHDRISRFSKIAGEMVPHLNVETAIAELVDANTERVCVVVGIPDDSKGEKLVVVHTDAVNPERTVAALRAKRLPNLWIPRANAFVRVDRIPVLGTGKVDLCAVKCLALRAA